MTTKAFIKNILDAARDQVASKAFKKENFIGIRVSSLDGSVVAVFQSTTATKDLVPVDMDKIEQS